jgi:hypothetical protein
MIEERVMKRLLAAVSEWLWPTPAREESASHRPVGRHRFTRHTPYTNHACEVVMRYRVEHPWVGVVANIVATTGELTPVNRTSAPTTFAT